MLIGACRVLVAGVGNIFLGDDGFGCEVARRLAARPLPDDVRVIDYGIGGIHLAYDLLGGVRASDSEPVGGDGKIALLVLVDAVPGDAAPGTVSLLTVRGDEVPAGAVDSHAMDPATVFASVHRLGGTLPPTVIVGCTPAETEERMGLSPAVEAAVEPTVRQILALLDDTERVIAHACLPSESQAST